MSDMQPELPPQDLESADPTIKQGRQALVEKLIVAQAKLKKDHIPSAIMIWLLLVVVWAFKEGDNWQDPNTWLSFGYWSAGSTLLIPGIVWFMQRSDKQELHLAQNGELIIGVIESTGVFGMQGASYKGSSTVRFQYEYGGQEYHGAISIGSQFAKNYQPDQGVYVLVDPTNRIRLIYGIMCLQNA